MDGRVDDGEHDDYGLRGDEGSHCVVHRGVYSGWDDEGAEGYDEEGSDCGGGEGGKWDDG